MRTGRSMLGSVALVVGLVQAALLHRAAGWRERLTGDRIPYRPIVLLVGIGMAVFLGNTVLFLLGGDADDRTSSWLVTLFALMFVGLRRKLLGIKLHRMPMAAPPPTTRPVEAMEDVTVRTETVE